MFLRIIGTGVLLFVCLFVCLFGQKGDKGLGCNI